MFGYVWLHNQRDCLSDSFDSGSKIQFFLIEVVRAGSHRVNILRYLRVEVLNLLSRRTHVTVDSQTPYTLL